MIYRADFEEHIGLQKSNLRYFFLHWGSSGGFSGVRGKLTDYDYKPIGPTILVEWEE